MGFLTFFFCLFAKILRYSSKVFDKLVLKTIMSRKYKFQDQDKLYFVSFAVVYWIDLFIRNDYKNILINSWDHCIKHKGMNLYGYCIMTSHVHMINRYRGKEYGR